MKIKKGKKYRCVKNPIDSPYVEVGRIYTCIKENEINEMRIIGADDRTDWFKLVQEPSTEELLKRIEALEKIVVKDTIKSIESALQPKDETIYVPDGILDSVGDIINGKHILCTYNVSWVVRNTLNEWISSKPNQFKLVPCKREDLKAGDVAFIFLKDGSRELKYELSNLECYSIVTEKGIVFWNSENGGIEVCNYKLNSKHVWYKVVEA